jgi:hypothetical protein
VAVSFFAQSQLSRASASQRSTLPLTPEWAIFFSAELAVLATLTGLVVVAISINLPRILSYPHLPTRAGEALIGPVGAITATSLVLIPEQPPMLLGAEVIVVGLVMVVAPIIFQARAWAARKDAWQRWMRAVSTTGFSAAFVIGGALVLYGARAGLYWIAAGDILGIAAIVLSAWVLMVEILR